MNINANRLISLALLAATMGGCDFNEDFLHQKRRAGCLV